MAQAHARALRTTVVRLMAQAHARALRTTVVRFVVACALALIAFGGAAGAAASTPRSYPARLAAIHRLTAAQFAAIERIYVAALPLDEFRTSDAAPPSKVEAATQALLRACGRLSPQDPLLRALRDGCPAISEFTEATAAVAACSDAACLKRTLASARAALRRGVSGSRGSDRAINATHLPRRCKRALVTPPRAYAVYDELDAALGKLEDALATASAADLSAAETALARAEKDANGLPTAKRALQLLRSACR
jgi:hypothetical protein